MPTSEQLLALAPDPATAQRGAEMANTKRWTGLGRTEDAIWGECAGSGSLPYLSGLDLDGPTFKCSCPVKKQPCKHTLGLGLLYASVPEVFVRQDPPEWMANWLEKRREKKQPPPVASPDIPELPDEAALAAAAKSETDRQKRAQERLRLMSAGIGELERWLEDLMREGMASAVGAEFWDRTVRSMVDAKLPGPANTVREMSLLAAQGDWQGVFHFAGDLYLLVRAFRRQDELEPALREELLNQLGVTRKKSEVLEEVLVRDDWQVLGIVQGLTNDQIDFRRTWLFGLQKGRYALLYDYAHRGLFESHYQKGTVFSAELAYYPGAFPLRAAIKDAPFHVRPAEKMPCPTGFSELLDEYAAALSQNPWLALYPAQLADVRPVRAKGQWHLADGENRTLPMDPASVGAWALMAQSGGKPIEVFGEWNGRELLVL
jgi:hypothetical protein